MRFNACITLGLCLGLAGAGCHAESSSPEGGEKARIGTAAQAVGGNIQPNAIQIDGPVSGSPGADLFPNVGVPLNAGATADWVVDGIDNVGTGCLGSNGIATCVEPNITGATGGSGHWNGLRIVDGIGSGDGDIFLTGGKENDTSTWNIGPGSVGSSKYDLSQAYLANNQTSLFFGMERSGNNGTTAFDFEFDQLAPGALPSCPQSSQIPCRSVGDVLFTFEMQGSGSSGSATPHIFTWSGSAFVEGAATGILSSINNSTSTAGAPWGHVDSKGNWVLGNLDRFTFAEALAPISVLPGVNSCGGKAYVQVRTRSSATAQSDLKDTSKVFEFNFNSPAAHAAITPTCTPGFNFVGTATDAAGNAIANPTCTWQFSDGTSSNQCSGFHATTGAGAFHGTLTISDPSAPGCTASDTTADVQVYTPIHVDIALQSGGGTCPGLASDAASYTAQVTGGNGNYTLAWTDASCSGASCTVNPSDSVFCADATLSVTVSDTSGLCAPAQSETESYSKTTTVSATDNP